MQKGITRDKLLAEAKRLRAEANLVHAAWLRITTGGAASASITTGAGAKSYSNLSPEALAQAEDRLLKRASALERRAKGRGIGIKHIAIVRS